MTDWICAAYGPEAREYGALCFFAGRLWSRVCENEPECQGRLIVERARVFDRIRELAAAGDPVAEYLAGEFSSPDELLGGDSPAREDNPVPDGTSVAEDHDMRECRDCPQHRSYPAECPVARGCGDLGRCVGYCRGPR